MDGTRHYVVRKRHIQVSDDVKIKGVRYDYGLVNGLKMSELQCSDTVCAYCIWLLITLKESVISLMNKASF